MRESKVTRLAKAVLFGLAFFAGALIGALILSVVLSREISGSEWVNALVFGVVPGALHYFLTPRMRRDRQRFERKLRDQQRRVR